MNVALATRVAELIQTHPTFGYRRLWALLRLRDGHRADYVILRNVGWEQGADDGGGEQ